MTGVTSVVGVPSTHLVLWEVVKVEAVYRKYEQVQSPYLMTSSNGNFFRIIGPLCWEFTGHRWIPGTKASDAELWCFDLRLNKRLSKQSWGWWFETPSRSLWRHCNDMMVPRCGRFALIPLKCRWSRSFQSKDQSDSGPGRDLIVMPVYYRWVGARKM